MWAKFLGKIWSVTLFLFNYKIFCCKIPEWKKFSCLLKWLSNHSAFIGSSAQIIWCSAVKGFVSESYNLNACGILVTEHSTRTTARARVFRTLCCFHLLCQLLPFLFWTLTERVNFMSYVPHLTLQIWCGTTTFHMLFVTKQPSQNPVL